MTSFTLVTSFRALSLNTCHILTDWGVRASPYECLEGYNSAHNRSHLLSMAGVKACEWVSGNAARMSECPDLERLRSSPQAKEDIGVGRNGHDRHISVTPAPSGCSVQGRLTGRSNCGYVRGDTGVDSISLPLCPKAGTRWQWYPGIKRAPDAEKKEPSYTVGGNANQYSRYGEQCGDSLKNWK